MAMKAGVPGALRRKVFRKFNYTCAECGIVGYEVRSEKGSFGHHTSVPDVYLSIDHIVPRSRGGTSDEDNLRVLCTLCNSKRGNKPLEDCA